MRYVRYLCIAIFAVALVSVALANRSTVGLKVLPDEVAGWFAVNPSVTLPLFLVILGSIVAGLLVGFIWEWIREHGERAEKARLERENRRLQREIDRLKAARHEGKDDVLALLDKAS